MRFPKLPAYLVRVMDTIQAAGGGAWLVGGALRDLMRGHQPKDWDLATTLTPSALLAAFPGSRLTGGVCGTVRVPFDEIYAAAGACEVTPCRLEGEYSDNRHPDNVEFVPDILADLSRRDFTVNAMAYDGKVLLDPFGGQQDLEKRLLRCVGVPKERFDEDPLRVLRLFRLAGQLGFTAEWESFCAANEAMAAGKLAGLPKERVLQEIQLILMSDGPGVLGNIIAKGGLQAYGFTFAPSLNCLAEVPRILLCRTWALCALCGAGTAAVSEAFGLSRRMAADLEECTALYRAGPAADKIALKQKLSRTRLDYAPIAATFAAISPPFAAEPAIYAVICANKEPYRLQDLAVDGDVLWYEGIRGERCGRVLEELLAVVIKNPSLNKPRVLIGLARGLKQLL